MPSLPGDVLKSPPCCAVHGIHLGSESSYRAQGGGVPSLPHPHPSCLLNPSCYKPIHSFTHTPDDQWAPSLYSYALTLEHFALQEGLDHIVGGGEIPGLVDGGCFEPS